MKIILILPLFLVSCFNSEPKEEITHNCSTEQFEIAEKVTEECWDKVDYLKDVQAFYAYNKCFEIAIESSCSPNIKVK
ncbi:hypothetical protein N9948_02110 [bacterium]|nr:hypothetical protein [bacterium]